MHKEHEHKKIAFSYCLTQWFLPEILKKHIWKTFVNWAHVKNKVRLRMTGECVYKGSQKSNNYTMRKCHWI